jgi:beta-phosphoglucomutase
LNKIDTLRGLIERSGAAVFDFDNVIADSEPYHFEAYRRVFQKRGHNLDREEYWREWTSTGGGAEGEIGRHRLAMDPDEIRAEKDPIYAAFCRSGEIKLFPEALRVADAFGRAGLVLAIASGSYERDIRAILRANGAEELFGVIVGKDGIERYKPHPETYLLAAKRLDVAPERCLAIEDADKGIKSAKGAGMSVILIETDITRALGITGADLACVDLEELHALLEEILAGKR